jgi:hypothetical protein
MLKPWRSNIALRENRKRWYAVHTAFFEPSAPIAFCIVSGDYSPAPIQRCVWGIVRERGLLNRLLELRDGQLVEGCGHLALSSDRGQAAALMAVELGRGRCGWWAGTRAGGARGNRP